jgi:hypothetical protein
VDEQTLESENRGSLEPYLEPYKEGTEH